MDNGSQNGSSVITPSSKTTPRNHPVSKDCSNCELPRDWRVRASRTMPGKFYYVNIKSGETSWTRPDDTTSESAVKQAEIRRQERTARKKEIIESLQNQESKTHQELRRLQDQLASIDSLLHLNPHDEEIISLRKNLKELVELNESELLQVKKERLKLMYSSSSSSSSDGSQQNSQNNNAGSGNKSKASDGPIIVRSSDSILERSATGEVSDSLPIVPETRCQAPFSTSYGIFAYHDAIIHTVEDDGKYCTVLFVTPLYDSMAPCKDYLRGNCPHDDNCIYSHGQKVQVSDLRPAAKIDYTTLAPDCLCLYRLANARLWAYGTLVTVADETSVIIRPHFGGQLEQVPLKHVRPVPGLNTQSSSHDSETSSDNDSSDESETEGFSKTSTRQNTSSLSIKSAAPLDRGRELVRRAGLESPTLSSNYSEKKSHANIAPVMPELDDDFCPIVLKSTPTDFAKWETFTKGIGSKILEKQGYVPGKGLGANLQGRVETVPVEVLPPGKSLDYIMNRRHNINLAKERKRQKQSVFDVLNKALRSKTHQADNNIKGASKSKSSSHFAPSEVEGSSICIEQSQKQAKKSLDVQVMEIYDEILAQEKEISRQIVAMKRLQGDMLRRAEQLLEDMESNLETLQAKKARLQRTKDSKQNLKKFLRF